MDKAIFQTFANPTKNINEIIIKPSITAFSGAELQSFPLSKIKPGTKCLIIGERGSGKTVALNHLLKHYCENNNNKVTAYFSSQEKISDNVKIPKSFVHTSFENNDLEKMIELVSESQINSCFVFDDMMPNSNLFFARSAIQRLMEHAHDIKATQMYTTQVPLRREHYKLVDYLFLSVSSSYEHKRSIWEIFLQNRMTLTDFLDLCEYRENKFLVIDSKTEHIFSHIPELLSTPFNTCDKVFFDMEESGNSENVFPLPKITIKVKPFVSKVESEEEEEWICECDSDSETPTEEDSPSEFQKREGVYKEIISKLLTLV